ncbi:MAG: nickel-responsive transcriptional regulator NikR [Bacteroidales bacterium]|nr:nickel-responsive transcriptional regulator NikR [Bacteroidales bacterium]
MAVTRFGVSLESDLLDALDGYVETNHFPNRSQAIRHLIEKNIVESKWQCNNIVAGAIVLIYNISKADLQSKISLTQSDYSNIILSAQHFFISSEKYLTIVALKGPSYKLTELSDKLISIKGIEHGKLIMSKAE